MIVKHWNTLPGGVTKCPSLEGVKNRHMAGMGYLIFHVRAWTKWSRGPLQHHITMILQLFLYLVSCHLANFYRNNFEEPFTIFSVDIFILIHFNVGFYFKKAFLSPTPGIASLSFTLTTSNHMGVFAGRQRIQETALLTYLESTPIYACGKCFNLHWVSHVLFIVLYMLGIKTSELVFIFLNL